MSLADRIAGDVMRIFYRESEFARRHEFCGQEILCIIDGDDAQRSRNLNAVSIEYDTGVSVITLRIPDGQLAERPMEGERVTLDGRLYAVELITVNEGETILLLKANEARTIV